MKQENQTNGDNLEQIRREDHKKRVWRALLAYFVCLLVAFAVWVVVRYDMKTDSAQAENVCAYETPATDVLTV